MGVYLDYGACAPVSQNILENIESMAEMFYNQSSPYYLGNYNKHVIEKVREKIASIINSEPEEIIFTSCASEANSLAVDGFLKKHPEYSVYCSNIEHSSILNNSNIAGYIECDKNGFLKPEDFELKDLTLFAVMLANNEIGSIQPIKEISKVVHSGTDNYLLCDATAVFGKLPIDVKELGVDMMSISAQKIGGIKGAGALYIKKGTDLYSIIHGEQEQNLRGGTLNDLAIKCFGLALDDIDYDKDVVVRARRNYLLDELLDIDGIHLNGVLENRLSNNINIRIDNLSIDNQQLLTLLDEHGYMVSAGSACHSGDKKPSHVLKAIGLSDNQANSSIRITIGYENSVRELEEFVECLKRIVAMYKQ